jgi:hypothetical protein
MLCAEIHFREGVGSIMIDIPSIYQQSSQLFHRVIFTAILKMIPSRQKLTASHHIL